jgi:hypothetical protein
MSLNSRPATQMLSLPLAQMLAREMRQTRDGTARDGLEEEMDSSETGQPGTGQSQALALTAPLPLTQPTPTVDAQTA